MIYPGNVCKLLTRLAHVSVIKIINHYEPQNSNKPMKHIVFDVLYITRKMFRKY